MAASARTTNPKAYHYETFIIFNYDLNWMWHCFVIMPIESEKQFFFQGHRYS